MRKYFFLALLLPCASPLASVNEPMRLEWQTGYRNDTFHWHLQDPGDSGALMYSERYRNLQLWENTLQFGVIHRDLTLFVRGALGVLGNGPIKQRFVHGNDIAQQTHFQFDTTYWTVDGWGSFGYAVNLTEDRTYKVILVPFIGYGVNYARIERQGVQETSGPMVALQPSFFTLISSLPKNLHTCWFGPLAGGMFRMIPGKQLRFEVGYAYHWEHARLSTWWQTELLLSSGTAFTTLNRIKVKDGSNLAQSGWAQIDWNLARGWRLGLYAQIQYLISRILHVRVETQTSSTPHAFKARWTAVSGMVIVSKNL